MAGRSQVERLPAKALAEVHAAIREGDTIDEITRRMRGQGGTCSRAAVGRYVKRKRAVLQRPAEDDDLGQRRRAERGERPEGGGAGRALETLRGLVTRAAIAVEEGRTPPDIENIGALALAIGRIENAGKAGAGQQKTVAREGDRKAAGRSVRPLPGWPRSPEEQKKGLSPDAVAHIRAAVAGQWGNQDPVKCEEAVAEAYHRMKTQEAEDE